jgi:hypothetical protein
MAEESTPLLPRTDDSAESGREEDRKPWLSRGAFSGLVGLTGLVLTATLVVLFIFFGGSSHSSPAVAGPSLTRPPRRVSRSLAALLTPPRHAHQMARREDRHMPHARLCPRRVRDPL